MMADMLGNQIKAGVASMPDFIENHKAGKLRIVAVIGDKRQAILPDVPTFAELGLAGLEELPYYGIFAPAGTPHAGAGPLQPGLAKVIAMPDVREHLDGHGPDRGLRAAGHVREPGEGYTQSWEQIIKASGFQAK